jgi:hypothetical protein
MKSANDLEQLLAMLVSDDDLRKLDDAHLKGLSHEQLLELSRQVVRDLKDARDRLNQNPDNSSRPPSTQVPWAGLGLTGETDSREALYPSPDEAPEGSKAPRAKRGRGDGKKCGGERRRAGKQRGAPGHGRKLEMAVTGVVTHRATYCAGCGAALEESAPFRPNTGFYVLDIEVGPAAAPALSVSHTKHLYGQTICCRCGHLTGIEPGRSEVDAEWRVPLTEHCLVGPVLASLIVCLALRMRLSRARIREFLSDWLSLDLSTGTINRCVHEAGRAVAPVEDQLVKELLEGAHLHADETPWKESGLALWLWVISSAQVSLYLIGYRSAEMLENVLGDRYQGWLMSDGYAVYRAYRQRLRCWAHLARKARGLAESLDGRRTQDFGQHTLELLDELIQAVYRAREGPSALGLPEHYAKRLTEFKALCESHRDCEHKKTQALAREFLNDWEAIWIVLQYPQLPLTNNEAEQALRHWVIARRISYGTRTEQGSRAFALLASVIETCRKRRLSPWCYLATVIAERRKGNEAPQIPVVAI